MSSSEVMLRLATEPVVCATLEQIARNGTRRALQKAIEDEVAEYLQVHRDARDDSGRRMVVRNGHKPTREVLTALGPIEVTQPRDALVPPPSWPRTIPLSPHYHSRYCFTQSSTVTPDELFYTMVYSTALDTFSLFSVSLFIASSPLLRQTCDNIRGVGL